VELDIVENSGQWLVASYEPARIADLRAHRVPAGGDSLAIGD